MGTKFNFDYVYKTFEEKKCKLLHSKDDFEKIYTNCKTKLKYIASCGHNHESQFRIFKSNKNIAICPNCVYINRSKILKEKSQENKIVNTYTETTAVTYLISIIENYFDIIKTFDSCKSDLIIKPKKVNEDLWLGIQIKSTSTYNNKNNCYYFNIKKQYTEQIIICISNIDKKIWGFEFNDLKHIKTLLQIKKCEKSKYNNFDFTNTIKEFILSKYENNKNILFNKNYLLNQLSKTTIIEYNFTILRKNNINFINFIENENQGEVFDFMVGNKKIQEKVGNFIGTINNKIYNYYYFNLSKCNGRGNKKIPYEKGDNSIYWFNCKDNYVFYVIPEEILIKYDYIGKKTSIIISNENKNKQWINDYKYNYYNLEKDKEKLCKILL